MTTYTRCPIGSVLRCPRTGDLYTRFGDQSGEPGWIALYVDHRTDAGRDPRMLPDATDLLTTERLPPGLVVLAPQAEAAAEARTTVVVDLEPAMDALLGNLAAAGWFAPLDEAGVS